MIENIYNNYHFLPNIPSDAGPLFINEKSLLPEKRQKTLLVILNRLTAHTCTSMQRFTFRIIPPQILREDFFPGLIVLILFPVT